MNEEQNIASVLSNLTSLIQTVMALNTPPNNATPSGDNEMEIEPELNEDGTPKEPVAKRQKTFHPIPDQLYLKMKVHLFLAHASATIWRDLTTSKAISLMNVNFGCNIMGLLRPVHNLLRKFGETQAKVEGAKNKYKFKYDDTLYETTIGELVKSLVNSATLLGFEYDPRNPEKMDWMSPLCPLVSIYCLFKYRTKELRIGNSRFPVGLDQEKVRARDSKKKKDKPEDDEEEDKEDVKKWETLKQYGLGTAHMGLCEGITFPPELKSSIPQSMGVITNFLTYWRTEERYRKKYYDAVINATKHLNHIDEFLQLMKRNTNVGLFKHTLTSFANLCLVASVRTSNRFSPPINFLLMGLAFTNKYKDPKSGVVGVTGIEFLKRIDYSGVGAAMVYHLMSQKKWQMKADMSPVELGQLMFHGIFATSKEDFGVLEAITSEKNWYQRAHFGDNMQKPGSAPIVAALLPKMIYWAKMASANQSGDSTSTNVQVIGIPTFSGRVHRTISPEVIAKLENEKQSTLLDHSFDALRSSFKAQQKVYLDKAAAKQNLVQWGTTSWYDINEVIRLRATKTPVAVDVRTNNKFWLGDFVPQL